MVTDAVRGGEKKRRADVIWRKERRRRGAADDCVHRHLIDLCLRSRSDLDDGLLSVCLLSGESSNVSQNAFHRLPGLCTCCRVDRTDETLQNSRLLVVHVFVASCFICMK